MVNNDEPFIIISTIWTCDFSFYLHAEHTTTRRTKKKIKKNTVLGVYSPVKYCIFRIAICTTGYHSHRVYVTRGTDGG